MTGEREKGLRIRHALTWNEGIAGQARNDAGGGWNKTMKGVPRNKRFVTESNIMESSHTV